MARLPVAARNALTVSVLLTATVVSVRAQATRQPMTDVSGAAQLVAFTGQVSVLRDSTPWALNIGDYVQPMQVIVTGVDGSAMFKVTDGSTFEVFPKSKVVFRADRYDWKNLLEVMLGKVRVQIEHFGGVPNNNKVRTPTAVISVRGTIFDVEYDDDADATLVLDEEGTVEVARALRLNDTKVLNPGEYVKVYKNDSLARATIDRGGLLQRIVRAAADALTQQAINSRTGAGSGTGAPAPAGATAPPPVTTTSAGDKNGGSTPTAPGSTTPPAPGAPPAPPAP
jgi:hypothetical protein